MKRLLAAWVLLAVLVGNSHADDQLSEDQREALIAKARSFQNIAQGKAMQVEASTEIKFTPQLPDNASPDVKKLLTTESTQKIQISLVTDGLRFCGSSDSGGGKRIDACFNGSKTVMVIYENNKPKNAMEKLGAPSYTRPDPNTFAGPLIAYTKYFEKLKVLDELLDQSQDTFVVSFLRMADGIVEKTDESLGKVFEAEIAAEPLVYSIQLRGADGACTQFKVEGPDSSVWTVTNTYSTDDSTRLLSSTRTVQLKQKIELDAATKYEKITFIDPQPSLFTLEVDASTPITTIK